VSESEPDVRAVLFDVDGTLVDTTYLHAVAWWHAFRQFDLDVPMASIHRAIGMGSDKLVPHLTGRDDEDELAELSSAHDAVYATSWAALRALPGARELVRHCHDQGLVTVLASSAKARELAMLRSVLDVDDAIDAATSADDADESKPASDLVEIALERAGTTPDHVLFVGDAVWDVEACLRAGVPCVGLTCGGTSAAELRDAGAVAVFRDAAELLARWREHGHFPSDPGCEGAV
jgi:HAD superfamily hydrolase (TIGR01509 family)